MPVSPTSVAAALRLPGTLTGCSLPLGWDALLRRYDEPVECEFETAPTPDQLIVMTRRGGCTIESWTGRSWRTAEYRPGDLGMIAPGDANRLRIHGPVADQTLQLHIPAALLAEIAELTGRPVPPLSELRVRHELTAAVMTALGRALEARAAPIYADAAVHHLVMQTVLDAGVLAPSTYDPAARPLRERIDGFMRENFSRAITLKDIAAAGGIGVFQLIRYCKATWGTTPAARLTTHRLDHAQRLLEQTAGSVTSIALDCGYDNPSHFATAFRRRYGVSPQQYRTAVRG